MEQHSKAPDEDLEAVAEALREELGKLVEAAEATLAELEAVEALLRAPAEDEPDPVQAARSARRDAMRSRTEAVEAVARARSNSERASRLEAVCMARIERARTLVR
jgi:hypothetical protein